MIKVVAKKRIGEANFITAIREALKNHYGDKVVGQSSHAAAAGGPTIFLVTDYCSPAVSYVYLTVSNIYLFFPNCNLDSYAVE